jgi:hypothetical protein
MNFRDAFNGASETIPDAFTANGAETYSTSGSAILDFFSNVCRPLPSDFDATFPTLLEKCVQEDSLKMLKCAFAKRDIRGDGGAGERDIFYRFYRWLYTKYPKTALVNLSNIPFFGYWKDLHALYNTPMAKEAAYEYARQLTQDLTNLNSSNPSDKYKISLAAKWCPSPQSGQQKGCKAAFRIAMALGLDKRKWAAELRKKYLSPLRAHLKVVESDMCAQRWDEIEYSKVPSLAMKIYRKAFERHDPSGFKTYLERVAKGESKINAQVLMPHQLVEAYLPKKYLTYEITRDETIEMQWAALVEAGRKYAKTIKNPEDMMMMAVPDFSCSMAGTPIMVALGLGLYIAKVCPTPFRDFMISFSDKPCFIDLTGKESLSDMLKYCFKLKHIGYNTNIQATMDLIVRRCVENKIPQEKMVRKLILISDMQFDKASNLYGCPTTNFNAIKAKFQAAGYQMPQIIFWNVQGKDKESLVKKNENGVAMISGWSKDFLKILMNGDIPDPFTLMNNVLSNPRYDVLQWVD